MIKYANYHIGQEVEIYDNTNDFVFAGIITKMGTRHVSVNEYGTGETYDVAYDYIYKKGHKKIADAAPSEIIDEEEEDGKKFVLSKINKNTNGKMSVKYQVTVDGSPIWESEEITTNIYDTENGWSSPDDFDDNKLDLIQQTAESGFAMVVKSYNNVKDMVQNEITPPESEGDGTDQKEPPKGEPAFAPGEGPEGDDMTDMGGGDAGMGTDLGEEGSDTGEIVEEGEEPSSEDSSTEPIAAEPEETSASLDNSLSFSRSILSAKQDNRLHNNPQHRLNPILLDEMKRRGIDSGNIHDIELADRLKDFDFSKK